VPLKHHRPLASTHFTVPWRVEGWVDLCGWLHTEIKCCLWESNADMITHPSINRAQRRWTLLIETNASPLFQTATKIFPGELLLKNVPTYCVDGMCSVVNTGVFLLLVNTGRISWQPVFTGSVDKCPWTLPALTGCVIKNVAVLAVNYPIAD